MTEDFDRKLAVLEERMNTIRPLHNYGIPVVCRI